MSDQFFLSTVTDEFGPLRVRLAAMLQRTKRIHVRHQDDFIHHGVTTLRTLEEEVAASDMIVHVIGNKTGWYPPVDQVKDFLLRNPDFAARFPTLVDLANAGEISATQWEVWMALFFNIPRILIFEFPDRLQSDGPQQQHSKRLHDAHHHPKPVDTDDTLKDEIILSLLGLGLLTKREIRPQSFKILSPRVAIVVGASVALVGYNLPLAQNEEVGADLNAAGRTDEFNSVAVHELLMQGTNVVLETIDPTNPTHFDDLDQLEKFYETGIPTAPKLLECLFMEASVEPDRKYVLKFSDIDSDFPVFYAAISEGATFLHENERMLQLSQELSITNPGTKEVKFITSRSVTSVKCYFKFYYDDDDLRSTYKGRTLTLKFVQEP